VHHHQLLAPRPRYTATIMPGLFASEKAVAFARVVVERGLDRYPDGLTYAVTSELADLQAGERVVVPLGKGDRKTTGYVLDVSRQPRVDLDVDDIKPVIKRDVATARLPEQLLSLARWISNYYCSPTGMTLASMLPAAVKKNVGAKSKIMIDFGDPIPLDGEGAKLPAKQRAVLDALTRVAPDDRPVEVHRLAELAGLQTTASIKRLVERGLLEVSRRTRIEALWTDQAIDPRVPEQLTREQTLVIDAIAARLGAGGGGFSTHLLYGVTGSGKTEVYIRLIQRVLEQGRVALMLVPEISLTPQTGGRLIGRFPHHRVAVLHSGLTAAQRHQQWVLAGEAGSKHGAHIVLGARSAVFAPIPDHQLGLIIVDEEHDGSYKQDQVPRYHGRDVAIRRAQLAGCPIVLGSATPSLESWHNATRGSYELHRLPNRAPGLNLPRVQVVDFRDQMKLRAKQDKRIHLIGPALESAIGRTLESGGQILLLLNRRGYASYIACPSRACGWMMTCDHCDVTVVYHLDKQLPLGGYVRCHHCLSEQKLPPTCPQCGLKLSVFGLGVQRVEEELSRTFPGLVEGRTMLRIDSDSMHGSRAFHDALARFGDGEIRLLLGTQMIAKGLDFPGVKLVGVINADTSIHLPDFRAAERTFQLVNQVAGRCGRGADAGLTIVQTFNPQTPAIQLAAKHDYVGFAKTEMDSRQQAGLPPITRMVRFVARDEDHVQAVANAKAIADALKRIVAGWGDDRKQMRLRGPAPCPIARIADKHRQQVEVIGTTAASIQKMLAEARSLGIIRAGADLAIDVDPIALM
jgi:primosomal protein N' (replication factor Y)